MHKRNSYISRIEPFIDKPVIKIITGMRRVGKSCFLKLLEESLIERGIKEKSIISVNLDTIEAEPLLNYKALYGRIKEETPNTGKTYVMIDEVQECAEWERTVETLFNDPRYDIFITGSNAQMLSSELATKLSGRYVEFPIYSLCFSEYLDFMGLAGEDAHTHFSQFLKTGGLPALHHFDRNEEVIYQYIESLYNTILLKDVIKRHNLRNVSLLENITRYTFDNIGNIFSSKKIADYVKSQRMSVGVETVQNYLAYIVYTYALHKVMRYDIKGKRLLEIHEKYYLGDIGLRHALLGYREGDIAGMLENIVYLELLKRGYKVHIGKLDKFEVDFIAERAGERKYIQVAYLLSERATLEREIKPLKAIKDNYSKLLLTTDTLFGSDIEGIRILNIVDFLLE
ncbi:MAG: ATP-binding protein [Proteobacteria bacterium]|nr:ATP-binding protein [Pseudomonadota bacterium]